MGNNAFVKAMNLDRARRNPFERSSERQGALNQAGGKKMGLLLVGSVAGYNYGVWRKGEARAEK